MVSFHCRELSGQGNILMTSRPTARRGRTGTAPASANSPDGGAAETNLAEAFARQLSEIAGRPVSVDGVWEAARSLNSLFELLSEWDSEVAP